MSRMFRTPNLLANSRPAIINNLSAAGKTAVISVSGIAVDGGGGGGEALTYDDPNSYVVVTAGGTFYWATIGGVIQGPEATEPLGTPTIESGLKYSTRYAVRGVVEPQFIQQGFNYLLDDGFGGYTWCNSSGIEEGTPVAAFSPDTENNTAYRDGELWTYIDIILEGGGGGT